jgi:hypothetical protein
MASFEELIDGLPPVFRKGVALFKRLWTGDATRELTVKTLTVDKLKFRLDAGVSVEQGEMGWNADEETTDTGLNDATLQNGLETFFHVKNNTGSTLRDGRPMMAAGTDGATGLIFAVPMDGTDNSNAKYMGGLATSDILPGAVGKVTNFGKVRDTDTTGGESFGGLETWIDGDLLFIDPANIGYLTNVEPEPPAIYMPVALVLFAHVSLGTLITRITPIDESVLRTTRMSLTTYSPAPTRNAQESIHGNLDPITTAADVNAAPVVLDVTIGPDYGQGKMVIVNNGVAETGVITIEGTSIDRDTGELTLGDTETIIIDATTVDNNSTDANSQPTWDLENAFITTKWWQGSADITITQDSGSLTDLDIYECAFDQFGEARSINLRILDMTVQALDDTALLSAHAYTVEVTDGKVNIQQIPDTEVVVASGFKTDKWYRYKRQNFNKQLDGRKDGVFLNMSFLGTGSPKFANITIKIWADIIP